MPRAPKEPEYDMEFEEYHQMRMKIMIDDLDQMIEDYKLAQSFYSYKNLDGGITVSIQA